MIQIIVNIIGGFLGSDFSIGKKFLSLLRMPNNFNSNGFLDSQKYEASQTEASSAKASSARIKRMRGWLGVKSSSSLGGYDDGSDVAYGDGHSGWNR